MGTIKRFNRREDVINLVPMLPRPHSFQQRQHHGGGGYHHSPANQYSQYEYNGIFPKIRLREVVCVLCSHRFYIGKDLRGDHSPLVLPCGHPTCSNCEILRPKLPCPHCPDKYVNAQKREKLLYNAYVVGLVHTLKSSFDHLDDPIMEFQQPKKALVGKRNNQASCHECSGAAHYDCKKCEFKFCIFCFKKIHKKALEGHESICLNESAVDLLKSMICPDHEEGCDYYCENCDIECCAHCTLKDHKDHKIVTQDERNQDLLPNYLDTLQKLKVTKFYALQTLKKFESSKTYADVIEKSKKLESKITQHFVHLHGYLQIIEHRLKSQIAEYRENIDKTVNEFETKLQNVEHELSSAYAAFSSAEKNSKMINMKKFTDRMLELADSQCHFIGIEEVLEDFDMMTDKSTFDHLDNHVNLKIPGIPKPILVSTEELPEDYELETMPEDETMNVSCSRKGDTSSALSSTPNQSIDQSMIEDKDTDSVSSYQPASIMVQGSVEAVTVTHVIDPYKFYVVRNRTAEILDEIKSSIDSNIDTTPTPDEVCLHKLYTVKCTRMNKWCRGRITNIEKDDVHDFLLYEVFYIDNGMTDTNVTIDRIRECTYMAHDGLAMECALHTIAPIDDEWYEDVNEKFRDMMCGEEFLMTIKYTNGNRYTVDMKKIKNNFNNLTVCEWLIDTEKASHVSIHKLKRMNPESSKTFYYDELKLNKQTHVHVIYVESPTSIYVVKEKGANFNERINKFSEEYKQYFKSVERPVREPEIGNPVAVCDPQGKYQRGLIREIESDEKKIHVHLVDYGNTVIVNYDKVYHLPQRFCNPHTVAIKVCLLDIKPVDDKWSTNCLNYMKKKLEGLSYVKVIPFSKQKDGAYMVVMYIKEVNIASNLVAKNFAISTGDLSKNPEMNQKLPAPKKNKKTKIPTFNYEESEALLKNKPIEETDPFKSRIIITKVISPDEIYASLFINASRFEEMRAQMQQFYQQNQVSNWDHNVKPGSIYCCWSPKDKEYCRAEFLGYSEDDPEKVKMLLVDIAEIEDIPFENIQPIRRQFTELPKNTFKIKLAGIRPCGGTSVWQSTSCEKLKEIIHDEGHSKYYFTSTPSPNVCDVHLGSLSIRRNVLTTGPLEPLRKETINVARRLIDEGLALPIKGFFDSDPKEPAVELQKGLKLQGFDTENLENTFEKKKSSIPPISDLQVIKEDERESEEEEKIDEKEEEKEDIMNDSSDLMPLPKYADWVQAAHLKEDEFDAVITYLDNDCDVYFYPYTDDYINKRNDIANTLQTIYSKKSFKKYDMNWEVGDLCIAQFHATESWCRGKITEIIDDQTVKVLFVDWGNIENCTVGHLKKRIVKEKIVHTPIQVMKASIEGISPVNFHWAEKDLDIMHRLLVCQQVFRFKVVSKPPESWKVAIWMKEGSTLINLPWYLKNKTQIECNIDLNKYIESETNSSLDSSVGYKSRSKIDEIIINVNSNESSKSSGDEASDSNKDEACESSGDENTEYGTATANSSNSDDDSKVNDSTTLRDEDDFLENTSLVEKMDFFSMNESLEITKVKSSSTTSLKSDDSNDRRLETSTPYRERNRISPEFFGNNSRSSCELEEMISGSILVNSSNNGIEYDAMSVRTNALERDSNDQALSASTPLNLSFTGSSHSNDSVELIDFQKYNVKCFEIGLGQAFSEVHMSGYLRDTDNWELKQWLNESHKIHEDIQSCVEDQSIFIPEEGDFCIAQFDDGMWYRARANKKIIKDDGPGTLVEFLDFGNFMPISDDDNCIRTIRPEWLGVPSMSFNFKLFNVKVAPGRKDEARKCIDEVLGQSDRYWVQIKKYKPELELEIYLNKKNKRLVYASLIEEGILEKINPNL